MTWAAFCHLCNRPSLFLDEIGELPHDLQAKLLRVMEEGRFERLGSTRQLQVNVFPMAVAPLRERPEDIPLLVWAFVRKYEKKLGIRRPTG